MTQPEEIATALGQLGNSPDWVAASLLAAGARGKRGDAYCCPVANFIRARFPDLGAVVVDIFSVGRGDDAPLTPEAEEVVLPTACREFVLGFDRGAWPELEEKS